MKTLLLLRHAKSSWDDSSLRDFDRPLSSRGENDAPKMGKALRKKGPVPDLILSSPAARAKATIEAAVAAAKLSTTVQFNEAIYGESAEELMKIVRKLPSDRSCVLLFGHNPGFEDLAGRLTGSHERMPTAALACIQFKIDDWNKVEDEQGELVWMLTPKQLGED